MKSTHISNIIKHSILIIICIFFCFPILWVFLSSFKGRIEFNNANFLPHSFHWQNYLTALIDRGLYKYYLNSFMFTILAVFIGTFICLLSAYALTRVKFKYEKHALAMFLVVIMLPGQLTIIPLFLLYKWLHLIQTPWSLIISYTWMIIPFGTFIVYGYMRGLSYELDEAARMDGAGHVTIFLNVIMPLCKPIISALIIIQSLTVWNEYMLATTFVGPKWYTLPVGTVYASEMTDGVANHPVDLAGAIIAFLPLLILFLYMQKLFIKGITGGMGK